MLGLKYCPVQIRGLNCLRLGSVCCPFLARVRGVTTLDLGVLPSPAPFRALPNSAVFWAGCSGLGRRRKRRHCPGVLRKFPGGGSGEPGSGENRGTLARQAGGGGGSGGETGGERIEGLGHLPR